MSTSAVFFKFNDTDKFAWAITKDIIGEGERDITGEMLREIKKDCPHHFKLYDDDGELYYEGYAHSMDGDEPFLPLNWAMFDSGCTEIKYRNPKTNKYESL